MEQLAYSGLVPEDAVAAGLSRLEAAELVAEAVSKADSQTLTEGNLELLNQLLTEFQAELAASKIRLEDLRQRLALSKPWCRRGGTKSILGAKPEDREHHLATAAAPGFSMQ